MQYLLLIYENERRWSSLDERERDAEMKDYFDFGDSLGRSKGFLGGHALQPTATATTVQVRDGKTLTSDGPFAETPEQLGGYYLIEAKDLDEAVGVAARVPAARFGSIEVRPIMKYEP